MGPWARTKNLELDHYGRAELRRRCPDGGDDTVIELGRIECAEVPAHLRGTDLGEQLGAELAELLDLWRDTPSRAALHGEWLDTYHRSRW